MSSKQSNVDYVVSQMASAGKVTAHKMFGEYGVYRGTKLVALICDDELFMKPTDAGRAFIAERTKVTDGPPYPGAKPYFTVGGDLCEDGDWLSSLVRLTADALPEPPPKRPKAAKAKTKPAKKARAKRR